VQKTHKTLIVQDNDMTVFRSYKLTEYNSLLEIPIYRVSPEVFEEEMQKELDKICNPLKMFEELFPANAKEKYDAHRHEMELHIGYPWKFNEIIGWVLLNIDGSTFSGDLFYKDAKRITKGSKSKINIKALAFRFDVEEHMTNFDVYSKILGELKGLAKKGVTKNRHIDSHRFETLGRYIDWKLLFEENT
jgi:hypothetical protein